MKAWIKAEDEEELKRLSKATDLCSAIFEFQNYLRGWYKNDDNKRTVEEVSEKFYGILDSKGIDLDEIYS